MKTITVPVPCTWCGSPTEALIETMFDVAAYVLKGALCQLCTDKQNEVRE